MAWALETSDGAENMPPPHCEKLWMANNWRTHTFAAALQHTVGQTWVTFLERCPLLEAMGGVNYQDGPEAEDEEGMGEQRVEASECLARLVLLCVLWVLWPRRMIWLLRPLTDSAPHLDLNPILALNL